MALETPIELFYSYAPEDEKLCVALDRHLSELKRNGLITWHRQKIFAGQDRMQEIESHLNSAQIILLLISASYLDSAHCYSEMERALERLRAGVAHVIPVLLSPCDWQNTPLANLLILPRNQKPIELWSKHDRALAEIAQEIRRVVEDLPPKSHILVLLC